ncbi:MAG: hypothetical protein LBP92_09015 [Deltaproteobacteria bacterium]|jgi:hypothetical protein|nr:hypothetical protein [Deltaproteobacteria bacterium]
MKILIGSIGPDGQPNINAGDIFEGQDYLDMLKMMIDPPFFTMNTEKDPSQFIDNCLFNIFKVSGLELRIPGDTIEARAENFFRTLIKHGLAVWMDN